jgi:hypothetical protein
MIQNLKTVKLANCNKYEDKIYQDRSNQQSIKQKRTARYLSYTHHQNKNNITQTEINVGRGEGYIDRRYHSKS